MPLVRLFLLFCSCLFHAAAFAQTTVSGRVLEEKGNAGLPGVTVLQTGTTNGVSTDAEGRFTLTLPESSDSVLLSFSLVGYVTRSAQVAAGSHTTVRLAADTRLIECGLMVATPKLMLGLSSGLRYAPFGGIATLYGPRVFQLPVTTTVGYHTNFAQNRAALVSVILPSLRRRASPFLTETLEYQHLRALAANVKFTSYTATMGVRFNRIGNLEVPDLLVGIGYARFRPFHQENAGPTSAGYGYRAGLQHAFLSSPFHILATVQATRWPGYWQLHSCLTHSFGLRTTASLDVNKLPNYWEPSVSLSHSIY